MTNKTQPVLILLAFLSATFIYAVNLWFSISGFYMVIITAILLLVLIFSKKDSISLKKVDYLYLPAIVFFIFAIFSFTNNVIDINGQLSLAMWVNRFIMFLAPLLGLFYFIQSPTGPILGFIHKKKYLMILFCSLIIQLTLIRIVRIPEIDVYDVVRWGPIQLLSGKNPYETPATVKGLPEAQFKYRHFAYGPTAIYLFLPFDLIFKEPRYLLILANMLTAICLFIISKKSWQDQKIAELISLIYLFNPRLVYFLTFSWTDGLIVSLIALGLLFLLRKNQTVFAICLSLVVGIKIFYALPFLFFFKNNFLRNFKFVFTGIFTIVIIHLPFLVWNWQAMYKSIVSINTGGEVFAQLQRFSLTLATFIDRQFVYYPPQFIFPILVITAAFFFWLTIRQTPNLARMLTIVSLVFIISVFLGPIANANYYFIGSQLILLAIALSGGKSLNY